MGCIPQIRKDLRDVLHLPLAGYGLLVQFVCVVIQVINLLTILDSKYAWWGPNNDKGYLGPEDATMLTFVALLLIVCLCGILGIVLKWTFGLRTIGIGFMILFVNCAVTIIVTLMVWFFTMCHVGGVQWTLHGTELYHALIVLGLQFLVVALAWHTISGLRSLQWVIAYGGNGWEKLNYKDIRNIYAAEAYLDDFEH